MNTNTAWKYFPKSRRALRGAMVVGEKYTKTTFSAASGASSTGSSGGGIYSNSIPKSPSFHSSLELAEATGRQITSINCNIFEFNGSAGGGGGDDTTTPSPAIAPTKSIGGGSSFVAKTIQNLVGSRFQQQQHQQNNVIAIQHIYNNIGVDKENNTNGSAIGNLLGYHRSNGTGDNNKLTINIINDASMRMHNNGSEVTKNNGAMIMDKGGRSPKASLNGEKYAESVSPTLNAQLTPLHPLKGIHSFIFFFVALMRIHFKYFLGKIWYL